MTLNLWRRPSASPKASGSPVTSESAELSAPDWVESSDRGSERYARLAEIAALIVVAGIVIEDWGRFVIFLGYRTWKTFWAALGPFMVAAGIAVEIVFSRLAASNERKVRDWYSREVAELDAGTQRLRKTNLELEKGLAPRVIRLGAPGLRRFSGTHVRITTIPDYEARRTAGALRSAFWMAGWIIDSFETQNEVADGIVFLVPTREPGATLIARELGNTLVTALGDTESHCAVIDLPPFSALTPIQVCVGYKPPPKYLRDL